MIVIISKLCAFLIPSHHYKITVMLRTLGRGNTVAPISSALVDRYTYLLSIQTNYNKHTISLDTAV